MHQLQKIIQRIALWVQHSLQRFQAGTKAHLIFEAIGGLLGSYLRSTVQYECTLTCWEWTASIWRTWGITDSVIWIWLPHSKSVVTSHWPNDVLSVSEIEHRLRAVLRQHNHRTIFSVVSWIELDILKSILIELKHPPTKKPIRITRAIHFNRWSSHTKAFPLHSNLFISYQVLPLSVISFPERFCSWQPSGQPRYRSIKQSLQEMLNLLWWRNTCGSVHCLGIHMAFMAHRSGLEDVDDFSLEHQGCWILRPLVEIRSVSNKNIQAVG